MGLLKKANKKRFDNNNIIDNNIIDDNIIDNKLEKFKKNNKTELPDSNINEMEKRKGLSIFDKYKLSRKPTKSFLITMRYSNGTEKDFILVSDKEMFIHKKRAYHLRYEDSLFNITHNLYKLVYHDDYFEPINKNIQLIGDKKFFAVKSDNAESIIKMEYLKVLANSQSLDQMLKTLILMVGISIFLSIILLIKGSGLISGG